ncbi:DUF4224 domain-containing protein [Paracidovorax konjaci]|uniref:DUF4224 domain-containing protein n=1 Tax=Paracidovorax konjaci TaxID=32040 RepID=A0A1I1YJY7_9BURK|nr:DUF4224 domain-containing protein [Paracidovorax konjaci]SFE19699.1 protein of unknown function [Paracidovorax konjaci]
MKPDPLSTELLQPKELADLTGTANLDQQERILTQDGIPYRRRGNRILVSRYHAREWLSGRVVTPARGVNLGLVT